MPEPGLLFVLGECGDHVTTEEFNNWYDNDHAPARLTVPGFSSALRYKATDALKPTWLAFYDMESTSVASSDAYKALGASASPEERSIISRLVMLNRRIYQHITTRSEPAHASSIPGKYLLLAAMVVPPELEADFNKWYEEEHLADLSKVPGWLRSRRFKLVSHVELAGKANPVAAQPTPNYIAMYDWMHDGYMDAPEFKACLATPWSSKIANSVIFELRRFGLHKSFTK